MYKDTKQISGCLGNGEAQAGITKGRKETGEGELQYCVIHKYCSSQLFQKLSQTY